MPSPYRAIFSTPGTRGFSAAGFIGRMPLSMLGIGIVTMMSQVTGRYGIAGGLAATLALAAAALGPQVSRLVDRYGQRRVLRPAAGITLLAVLFMALGVVLLTAQRATEPPPHPREQHTPGSALRSRGLQVLVLTFVATGAIFGAVDVNTVAFAEEQGHKAAASVVLAVYAAGSCLAGVLFGLMKPKGTASRRFLLGVAAMGVSMIPPLLVGNLPFLAVALFVAGLSIAPTMVTTMALVEQLVPRAKLTEGMTWTSTGLAVGVALGASLAGWVIDAAGARAAFVVPASAAALAVVAAFLGYRRLEPAPDLEGTRAHGYDEQDRREGHMA